ncbi:MAG TPA: glycosyltransferase family 9 protein [Thermoanaerobaculia bacterium]|nr:glycosyltransferase family 9 protein [Thermoanaerobaculia bacterium]
MRAAAFTAPNAPSSPLEPRSIFVLRNNDIGDLLVVTPLFEALRQRFPLAYIAAGVGRWNLPCLQGNPYLSEVIVVDAPWFNKFVRGQSPLHALSWIYGSQPAREIARRGFDVGIDVLGSPWGSLLLIRAHIPWRLGVHGYAGGHTGAQACVQFDPWEHVCRSALRFAEMLGATDLPPCRPQIFLDPEERRMGEECWRGLFAERPDHPARVVIGPGGGLAVKCWPRESYAALAGLLARRAAVEIAIMSGPRDRETGAFVAAAAPGSRNLAGQLSLRETFALVAAADLVVCNSSMLMHVAAAFGKPTLVLLGASFSSARQHDAQWGYPDSCHSLGRERGVREEVATPEEALSALRAGSVLGGTLAARSA